MESLTPRQFEILAFIREYLQTYSYSPSVRDVAAHFGISVPGAQKHIEALVRRGAIEKSVSTARSIRVVDKNKPLRDR